MTSQFSTTKGEITIRMANPGDAAIVRSLRLEGLSLHPEALSADLEMTASEGADVWAERIAGYAASSSGAIYIAFDENNQVGRIGIGNGH
jgi:hypothetical protein